MGRQGAFLMSSTPSVVGGCSIGRRLWGSRWKGVGPHDGVEIGGGRGWKLIVGWGGCVQGNCG